MLGSRVFILNAAIAATVITSPSGDVYVASSPLDGSGTSSLSGGPGVLRYKIDYYYTGGPTVTVDNLDSRAGGGYWFVDTDNDNSPDMLQFAGNVGTYRVQVFSGTTLLDTNTGNIISP